MQTILASSAAMTAPTESNNQSTVLLQTVQAWILSENNGKKIRALLDGGSQRSFIREDVSRALNLPVVAEVLISIPAFVKGAE